MFIPKPDEMSEEEYFNIMAKVQLEGDWNPEIKLPNGQSLREFRKNLFGKKKEKKEESKPNVEKSEQKDEKSEPKAETKSNIKVDMVRIPNEKLKA